MSDNGETELTFTMRWSHFVSSIIVAALTGVVLGYYLRTL